MENDYSITDSDNNDDPPPEEDLFLQILKKNLGKFYELDDLEDEDEPYIIADKREKRSGIIDILSETSRKRPAGKGSLSYHRKECIES